VPVPTPLSQFHDGVNAFEERFERELIDRWPSLEDRAGEEDWGPSEKRSALDRFFNNAEKVIAAVVHEHFPRLLQVATAQRRHLGKQSPIAWTRAQVLRQVCSFLGVEEKFDHTSAPRDGSRVVAAVAQIALGIGWPDEIPADFLLPGWLGTRWAWRRAVGDPNKANDAESLAQLSRAETVEWIKNREFLIRRRLELQIDKDSQDGIIAAAAQTSGQRSAEHGASRNRRQKHPDPRKELIAILRRRQGFPNARKICEGIDKEINTRPISKAALAPLESWRDLAPSERSWVGFYDNTETHQLVRSYVNKVPRLNTAKSPK